MTNRTSAVGRPRRDEPKSLISEDSAWLAERRAFDIRAENAVAYYMSPRKWHAALIPHRDELRAAAKKMEASHRAAERFDKLPEARRQREWDSDVLKWRSAEHRGQGLIEKPKAIAFRVSLGCYLRALAIVNAIAFALQRRGFNVTDDRRSGRIVVSGHGGRLPIRVTERLKERIRRTKTSDGSVKVEKDRLPTGILRLALERGEGGQFNFSDEPRLSLESQLRTILDTVYRLIIRCRVKARKDAEDGRQRKEVNDAQARVEATRQVREKDRQDEQQKRSTLIAEARQHYKSAEIRRYVAHMLSLARSKRLRSGAFARWLSWATKVAADLDPSVMRMHAFKRLKK